MHGRTFSQNTRKRGKRRHTQNLIHHILWHSPNSDAQERFKKKEEKVILTSFTYVGVYKESEILKIKKSVSNTRLVSNARTVAYTRAAIV